MDSILSLLPLEESQRAAVDARDADVIVTAGAGSGKTRTLVARVLALLEEGVPLRALAAITFTDKAAREMRNRIRREIGVWLEHAANARRAFWENAYAELDSALIGTIHSLCATILRAHPAEAALDPDFGVLDENASAALRAQAVENALASAANDAALAPLFPLLRENALREILTTLLNARLDAQAAFDAVREDASSRTPPGQSTMHDDAAQARMVWQSALERAVAAFVDAPTAHAAVQALRAQLDSGALERAGDAKLAAQIASLPERWARIETSRDWDEKLRELFTLRRTNLGGGAGKAGAAKEAVKSLRELYDATLDPWLGGKNSTDKMPRWSLDERAADALPRLRRAFELTCRAYEQLKAEHRALDFDDLEARTVSLLENNAAVRERWQANLRAVLVDEFQDTNDRQRRIIYALRGFGDTPYAIRDSRLFIVGDGKQSIYRFRGGDVTVLRRVANDLTIRGGKPFNLDLTYRAHAPLVAQLNALLEPILGTAEDPARPYAIPFAPLRAFRATPREKAQAPFVEFCLGCGDDAEDARAAAADALARRLYDLREREAMEWGDVALLLRASTHFGDYESAFERADIPFVTVAGKGFYRRPEVRDVLNLLAAVADPTDDRALAGALRSPALGLSDGALYILRRGAQGTRSLWAALASAREELADAERARAERAREILRGAMLRAERVSVAAVLKYLLDATDYDAILARAPGGERARRNIAKLLADAHASGLVSPREFLEFVQTLREVQAREGEAAREARGAVQLMTVHKAKGLEFPVVVLADAAHAPRGTRSLWLDRELGPLFALDDETGCSVIDRLAKQRDDDQSDAEERRLLYVAATRAREKLLVSGHAKRKKDGTLSLGGWLRQLGQVVALHEAQIPEAFTTPIEIALSPLAGAIGCTIAMEQERVETGDSKSEIGEFVRQTPPELEILSIQPPISNLQPPVSRLQSPIPSVPREHRDERIRAQEVEPPRRVWRVIPTAQRPRGPAWVVGKLVHEALRRWRFPDRADFETFLYPHALAAGLTDPVEIGATLDAARRLLARFQQHPLYVEMERAERFQQIPFALAREGRVERGAIDMLYRVGEQWTVVDFRTDEIRSEEQLLQEARAANEQGARYLAAVQQLLGVTPAMMLCFFDVGGQVRCLSGSLES